MSLPEGLVRDPQGMLAGDLVVARAWKYDGAAHWVVPGRYLGADRHGHWVFQPRGAFVSRPGRGFLAASDAVCLFPREGDWVATFYDEAHPDAFRVYVDISAGIGWRRLRPAGWEVNSIDMDLDVCDVRGRAPFVDDEDEFADHARTMRYPNDLARRSQEACGRVLDAVRNAGPPFDGSADAWFAAGRTGMEAPGKALG